MARTFLSNNEAYDPDFAFQAELNAVEAAAQLRSEKGSANGYAPLDANNKLPSTHVIYGTTADSACIGNDARLSDVRIPTGTAAGDLAGTYPNPTVAKASQSFALTGVLTPAQITADTNNYAPVDLATATVLRLSSSASYNLTGLSGGVSGRVIVIQNVGAHPISLLSENIASTAANRFSFSQGFSLSAGQSLLLQYDSTLTRWKSMVDISPPTTGTTAPPTNPYPGQSWFNTNTGWNICMYWDSSRSKWLSSDSVVTYAGRAATNVNSGTYLRVIESASTEVNTPITARAMTIVGLTSSTNATQTATFAVRTKDSVTGTISADIATLSQSAARFAVDTSLSVDVAAYSGIVSIMTVGTSINNPTLSIHYKYRWDI